MVTAKKKSIWYYLKRDRFIYMLLLPGILYYLIFHYLPMLGIVIAFKDYKPYFGLEGIFTSPWVGLKHFKKFFGSAYCGRLIRNTLLLSIYHLIWGFPVPIILALFINELRGRIFKRTVQTISYLPHFLSTVIVCGIIRSLVSVDGGLINVIIKAFGGEPISFLSYPQYFRTIYTASGIWSSMGWSSIVYIAAMAGIDQELYDAAKVDGAGVLKRMWHITIPCIMPTICLKLILQIGDLLSVGSGKILLLYNPQIYSTADVISTYVYREGIGNMNFSYATAVGLFNSIVGIILVVSANTIVKKLGQEGIW